MKKIKNIIALLLVFTIIFALGACGKGDNTDASTDGTTQGFYAETPIQDYNETSGVSAVIQPVTEAQNTTLPVSAQNTTVASQSSAATDQVPQSGQALQPTQPATVQSQATVTTEAQAVSGVNSVVYDEGDITQIVYYPAKLTASNKKYPVIAWANGTGCPPDLYAGLLQQLAEGGYVVIANSETMAADGTAQIGSVDFILNESKNSSSIFYKKINTDKIGVAGHSQGGRSSVNAAAADSRIDCVLSLAGSNYVEEAEKLSAPAFFVAGTNDMIVSPEKWIVTAYNACKGPAVYASLDGAIHTTCCTDPSSYSEYAIEWFDLWLKNDSGAKSTFVSGGALSTDGAWVDFACKGL